MTWIRRSQLMSQIDDSVYGCPLLPPEYLKKGQKSAHQASIVLPLWNSSWRLTWWMRFSDKDFTTSLPDTHPKFKWHHMGSFYWNGVEKMSAIRPKILGWSHSNAFAQTSISLKVSKVSVAKRAVKRYVRNTKPKNHRYSATFVAIKHFGTIILWPSTRHLTNHSRPKMYLRCK